MKETIYPTKIGLAPKLVLSEFNSNMLFSAAGSGKYVIKYWIVSDHGSYTPMQFTDFEALAYDAVRT